MQKWRVTNKDKNRLRQRKDDRSPKRLFSKSKLIAKRRKLSWDIEFKDYLDLRARKCYYCNENLNETGIGLDRIDNSLGYSLKNVLPCCRNCNLVRHTILTVEETVIAMKAVLEYRKKLKFDTCDQDCSKKS